MKKILIANRGEIAVRIIRACREMGVSPVAVYSDCDRAALHVRYADEAYPIGPSAPRESYLRIDRLIDAARRSGADAVHPGYGFLAENEAFAAAVRDAGLTFIGPTPEAIETMGSKTAARTAAKRAGVRVVPGTEDPLAPDVPDAAIAAIAESIGYPVLVKAVSGGGGKGMRTVSDRADLSSAVRAARSEAGAAFGDAAIYLERRLTRPRHIEVQLLGDSFGTVLPFVERECSIQRRHQKVVEETPSLAISGPLRRAMTSAAAAVASAVGYTNAGTVEFLLDEDGRFYFLEMNTRLQVEHPITEWTTRLDLVREQILVARGAPLSFGTVTPHGHAIECRLYSEDPAHGFLPATGTVLVLDLPSGPWVRFDGGIAPGSVVGIDYDPLLAKISTWGATREEARGRMLAALDETVLLGIVTNRDYLRAVVAHPAFAAGATHTEFLTQHLATWQPPTGPHRDLAALAAALALTDAPVRGAPAGATAESAASLWETLSAWRPGGAR